MADRGRSPDRAAGCPILPGRSSKRTQWACRPGVQPLPSKRKLYKLALGFHLESPEDILVLSRRQDAAGVDVSDLRYVPLRDRLESIAAEGAGGAHAEVVSSRSQVSRNLGVPRPTVSMRRSLLVSPPPLTQQQPRRGPVAAPYGGLQRRTRSWANTRRVPLARPEHGAVLGPRQLEFFARGLFF